MTKRKEVIPVAPGETFESDPFVITKSYYKFIDTTKTIYSICKGIQRNKCKEIPKDEAMELIKEYGLVVAIETKHGIVWDSPSRAFFHAHRYAFRDARMRMTEEPYRDLLRG